MSDFKPLEALIFDTEVPYFRARAESVSPLLTVCLRLPVDFFFVLDLLFDDPFDDEPEETFTGLLKVDAELS